MASSSSEADRSCTKAGAEAVGGGMGNSESEISLVLLDELGKLWLLLRLRSKREEER